MTSPAPRPAGRRLAAHGISLQVPFGWEARFTGPSRQLDDGGSAHAYLHAANFDLPLRRAPFGSGVVGEMGPSDAFVALLEYAPESAATPLFGARGVPTRLQGGDFSASALQRSLRGQSGCQRFFHVADRAFCLYVVLGGRPAHRRGLEDVNLLLSSTRFSSHSVAP
jgi:hypothetical protein